MQVEILWEIERALWLEGREAYENYLDPNCLMVFAQMGIVAREAVINGLEQGARWSRVTFAEQQTAISGDTVVLAYLAEGQRDGQSPYRALCSSTYIETPHGWRILGHQQTPAG